MILFIQQPILPLTALHNQCSCAIPTFKPKHLSLLPQYKLIVLLKWYYWSSHKVWSCINVIWTCPFFYWSIASLHQTLNFHPVYAYISSLRYWPLKFRSTFAYCRDMAGPIKSCFYHPCIPYIHAGHYRLQYKHLHKYGLEQFTAPTGTTTIAVAIGINLSRDSVTHHCKLSYTSICSKIINALKVYYWRHKVVTFWAYWHLGSVFTSRHRKLFQTL